MSEKERFQRQILKLEKEISEFDEKLEQTQSLYKNSDFLKHKLRELIQEDKQSFTNLFEGLEDILPDSFKNLKSTKNQTGPINLESQGATGGNTLHPNPGSKGQSRTGSLISESGKV